MNAFRIQALILAAVLLAGCGKGTTEVSSKEPKPEDTTPSIAEVLQTSYVARGQATMDRLDQDFMQQACSGPVGMEIGGETSTKIINAAKAAIVYPEDGNYLGDWKAGEEVAQQGKGMQYSDDPSEPNGGNCYACHELSKTEIAYGTMGPSLKHYGRLRGDSEQMLKYAWERIWDSHAYLPCTHMPAFGAKGILTEQQIKDVMALLFDPESPVNL